MPTKQHNRFLLQMMERVRNLRIVITDHRISSGQPWENTPDSIQKSGNTWEIDAQEGRHGTDTVAQWFKNKISGGNAIGCSSYDGLFDSVESSISRQKYNNGKKFRFSATFVPDPKIAPGLI